MSDVFDADSWFAFGISRRLIGEQETIWDVRKMVFACVATHYDPLMLAGIPSLFGNKAKLDARIANNAKGSSTASFGASPNEY